MAAAVETVDAWLGAPWGVVLEPGVGHSRLARSLLPGVGSGGNLVNDAHLAALALEHRCTLVSYDRDFARFEGLSWTTPGGARG